MLKKGKLRLCETISVSQVWQDNSAGDSEKCDNVRKTEEEMRRQHHKMDRHGV